MQVVTEFVEHFEKFSKDELKAGRVCMRCKLDGKRGKSAKYVKWRKIVGRQGKGVPAWYCQDCYDEHDTRTTLSAKEAAQRREHIAEQQRVSAKKSRRSSTRRSNGSVPARTTSGRQTATRSGGSGTGTGSGRSSSRGKHRRTKRRR